MYEDRKSAGNFRLSAPSRKLLLDSQQVAHELIFRKRLAAPTLGFSARYEVWSLLRPAPSVRSRMGRTRQ